jgi:hypothetical protein
MIEKIGLLDGKIYRKLLKTFFLDDYIWEKVDMVEALRQAASI